MVEANVWYLVTVNSKFVFIHHLTVLFNRDDRFLFCVRKSKVIT